MGEYKPYGSTGRQAAKKDYYVWLFASLSVSLLPFLIVGVAYWLFHHTHTFPWSALLGRGELLLVVLSVTGATAGEMIFNPSHLIRGHKRFVFMITIFIGMASLALFVVTAYCQLTKVTLAIDRPTTMLVSVVLLTLDVINQTVTVLTRPAGEDIVR